MMVRKTAKSLMEERTCRGWKLNVRVNNSVSEQGQVEEWL